MGFDFVFDIGREECKKSAPAKASALLRTCDVLEGAEVAGKIPATLSTSRALF